MPPVRRGAAVVGGHRVKVKVTGTRDHLARMAAKGLAKALRKD